MRVGSLTPIQARLQFECCLFFTKSAFYSMKIMNNLLNFISCLFFSLTQDFNEQCPYSLSPVSAKSQKLLRSPRKATRKISRIPFKVLDAPELQDDFYLNLVDWSAQNVLAVGLGSCVYLWSACTSQVSIYCVNIWDCEREKSGQTENEWNLE